MTEFETQCKWGDHRIKMVGSKAEGWKPFNLDGTPHNCKGQNGKAKPQETIQPVSPPSGDKKFIEEAEQRVRQIVREELAKLFLNYQKASEK